MVIKVCLWCYITFIFLSNSFLPFFPTHTLSHLLCILHSIHIPIQASLLIFVF